MEKKSNEPKIAAKGIQLGFNSKLLTKEGFLSLLTEQRSFLMQEFAMDCLSPQFNEAVEVSSDSERIDGTTANSEEDREEIEELPLITNRGIIQRFGSMVTYKLSKRNFHCLYVKRSVCDCGIHTKALDL